MKKDELERHAAEMRHRNAARTAADAVTTRWRAAHAGGAASQPTLPSPHPHRPLHKLLELQRKEIRSTSNQELNTLRHLSSHRFYKEVWINIIQRGLLTTGKPFVFASSEMSTVHSIIRSSPYRVTKVDTDFLTRLNAQCALVREQYPAFQTETLEMPILSDGNSEDPGPAELANLSAALHAALDAFTNPNPHPLTAATLEYARTTPFAGYGYLNLDTLSTLNIRVHVCGIRTAFTVMDSILLKAQQAGMVPRIGTADGADRKATVLQVGSIELCIRFRQAQYIWEEHADRPFGRGEHRLPGVCYFDISYRGKKLKSWSQSQRTPLEDRTEEIVTAIAGYATECRERPMPTALPKAQVARWTKRLLRECAHWEEARRVRAYIQAHREAIAAGRLESNAETVAWLDWAEEHADSIDPLA
jgi:hypothetical protein